MELTADRAEIRRALEVILGPEQVTELRALHVSTNGYRRPHTESGYFDDFDALADAAVNIQAAAGIYFVPNPVDPALLSRAANRARAVEREPLTSDPDIMGRRWLLVDFDAKRPAGISSTDREHDAALSRAKEVGATLKSEGWPKPIFADSGNGAHLLYRIDLPNDDPARTLVERCLKALDFRFSDEAVEVDTTCHNAARIWKLYGTPACKGDHTADRPHRLSRLIYPPNPLIPVPLDLLTALAATLPSAPEPARAIRTGTYTGDRFDVEMWIHQHGLDVIGPHPWNGGRKWTFLECPWNSDHRNRSAFIVELAGGAIAAGCQHNSCQGHDWHALRDLFEPGWRDRRGNDGQDIGKTSARHRQDIGKTSAVSAAEVIDEPAHIDALAGFGEWVNKKLGQRSGREMKRRVSARLTEWLLGRDRLLFDPAANECYLLTDAAAVVSLGSEALELRAELARAGFNPSEPAFAWLRADLETSAFNDGRKVTLYHGATHVDGVIRVSCGPERYVEARQGAPLRTRRNGDDGILFAKSTAFPAWDPEADLVSPLTVRAFTPNLTAPAEVPGYSPDVQKRLLLTWLAGVVSGLRPLPLLAVLGDKGGGKSSICRAVVQVFYGRDANVAALTSDEKDFWVNATGRTLFALDNLDTVSATWLPDALAAVVTGVRRQARRLYTDNEQIDRFAISALLVNSRTASFARPDVAERTIPLFVGDLVDDKRVADSDLSAEVAACRDGLLVYLLTKAVETSGRQASAPAGLPARFLDYARWVWAWYSVQGDDPLAVPALAAWRQAQALSIGDADPLLSAILEYGDDLPETERFQNSPAGLLRALTTAGAGLPHLGGGRAIANKLRELKPSLEMAGWKLTWEKYQNGTAFTLTRK